MTKILKNITQNEILSLSKQVDTLPGQIVSKTLSKNEHHSLTLFAFDKDGEISSHASDGDALVTVLDGTGKITIEGKEYILQTGESIVMPAGIPHAVYAQSPMKMFLTVIFD